MRVSATTARYLFGAASLAGCAVLAPDAEAQTARGSFRVGIFITNVGTSAARAPTASARMRYTAGAAEISVARAGMQPLGRVRERSGVYCMNAQRGGAVVPVAVSVISGRLTSSRACG